MTVYIGKSANANVANLDANPHPSFAAKDPTAMRFASAPVYDVTHPTFGAVGDGVADDYNAFNGGNTAATASGILQALPGTYKLGTSLSFTSRFKPVRGCMLQPAAGVNIDFAVEPEDVPFQYIDLSKGGTVSYSGAIQHTRPEWLGLKGDNVNADWIPFLLMWNMMPNWTKMKLRRGLNIKLHYGMPLTVKQGVIVECDAWTQDAWSNTNNTTFHYAGPAGGTMVINFNNGYCLWRGITFDPGAANTAAYCIDSDMLEVSTTALQQTVQTHQANGGGGVLGASFFKSLAPNIQIGLSAAGAGGTPLYTSLSAVADDQHATLAIAASTTVQGNLASFSPAGYAQPPRPPSSRISTKNFFEFNQFLCVYGAWNASSSTTGIAVSRSAQANCEYFAFRYNQFFGTDLTAYSIPQNGNGNGRANFNSGSLTWSFSAPGGSIAAASNRFMGFAVDTFTVGMNGARIRIAGAGASSTGARRLAAVLDGYAKYIGPREVDIFSDPGLTTPLNASNNSPVGGHFTIGGCLGVGMLLGPAFNAKRQIFYENSYENLNIGKNMQGGSHHDLFENYSNNDVNKVIGVSQSEPSSDYGANSENSRCHSFVGSPQPYTIEKSRFAMGLVSPSDGYFKVVAGWGAPMFRFIDDQVENVVPATSSVFMSVGQVMTLVAEGNRFADVSSIGDLGWDGPSPGGVATGSLNVGSLVYQRANVTPNATGLLPFESMLNADQTGISNGQPLVYRRGTTFFTQQYVVQNTDFIDAPSWAFYSWPDTGGNGRERVWCKFKQSNAIYQTLALEVSGMATVTDGANVTIDPRLARGFFWSTAQAAPHVSALPGFFYEMQEFFLVLKNNSGGAIAPTWDGSFHVSAGITYPANTKQRTYHFYVLDGIAYEKRWDSDVS